MKRIIVMFGVLLLSRAVLAHTAHPHEHGDENMPQNRHDIILLSDSEHKKVPLEELEFYLQGAARPGHAHWYALAERVLAQSADDAFDDPRWLLARARVVQHRHHFDRAETLLHRVLAIDGDNVNAHLMLARIHLIRRDHAAARRACLNLVGHSDLLTSAICLLEVSGLDGQLSESYHQLSGIVRARQLDHRQLAWASQVLADMAYRLDRAEASERWLDAGLHASNDVSYLAAWADIKLERGKARRVLAQIIPLVPQPARAEDALLLRLALAERAVNRAQGDQSRLWRHRADARFARREQSGDRHHAGDMARYYLDLADQPRKALQWAEINWRQVREPRDFILLERARARIALQKNSRACR